MGPEGAYLKGWAEIGPMWDEVTAARLGGLVTPKDVRTVVGRELALVTCIESGENISDGKTETVRIRSSTVFVSKAVNGRSFIIRPICSAS